LLFNLYFSVSSYRNVSKNRFPSLRAEGACEALSVEWLGIIESKGLFDNYSGLSFAKNVHERGDKCLIILAYLFVQLNVNE